MPNVNITPVTAGMSRAWLSENGVGPTSSPDLLACAKVGETTWNVGERTRIECQDPNTYNRFIEVGSVPGTVERPTASISGLYPMEASELLRLTRRGCRVDLHVLMGDCQDPQDFENGWQKIKFYRDGFFTSWADENAGALQSDDNAETMETVEFSAAEVYEITRLTFAQLADTLTTREITTINVCDSSNCSGDCGDVSDGCQKVFATMIGVGATPGTQPTVLYSGDGGGSFASTIIDTMLSNETPDDAECIGDKLVIVSNTSGSLHYADTANILNATETWVESIVGFVVGNGPNALWSVDARNTWVVGDNGYIYYTSNPVNGVEVQDAGISTVQDLQAVHAVDKFNVLAVGDINAVVLSTNGGATWQAILGPSVGNTINTVWMWSTTKWFLGTSVGELFYTTDSGANWTEIALAGVTEINHIEFMDEAVGFMSVRLGGEGRIYRTINGGADWWELPEGTALAIPGNDYISDLAVCQGDPNVVYGGGLDADGTAGIIVKAS